MARESTDETSGLGARLRRLRERYDTFTVLTAIVHLDAHFVAMRATLSIAGQVRAHGHAAKAADKAGAFVGAAEQLAVQQALFLGGFDGDDSASAETPAAPTASPNADAAPTQQALPTVVAESAAPPAVQAATTPAVPIPTPAPTAALMTEAEIAAPPAPARKRDRSAERDRARARKAVPTAPPEDTPEEAITERAEPLTASAPAPVLAPAPPLPTEAAPQPPAPQLDTPAASEAQETQGARVRVGESAPDTAQAPPRTAEARRAGRAVAEPNMAQDMVVLAAPDPAPPRRTRARSTAPATAPATVAAPSAPQHPRESWTAGRPIPAWWPPERPSVAKQVTKAQVERLRAIALAEEITPALLDTYSTMLFDQPVGALNQDHYAILEERLNPAYPSPLEETGARRLRHPIAVGDHLTLPEDRPIFIRWRDVPPVAAAPEPAAPTTPSWRTRGVRGTGRRRR